MKISVVINTYNADADLERVLESVKEYDEILICDMHSTDRTLEIAKKYGCKVVFHEHTGIVEPARAYAISQAKNTWVLVIDADEVIQPKLHKYLTERVELDSELRGVRIPRKNYMFGRFVRVSYPDYQLRFFRKDSVDWPTTIHAQPTIDGETENIPKKRDDLAMIHLANESMRQLIEKANRYTEFELQRRKHRKYGYSSLMFQPMFVFVKLFIFKGGFRDGVTGYIYAKISANYKFITIAKVIESKIDPNTYTEELK